VSLFLHSSGIFGVGGGRVVEGVRKGKGGRRWREKG
jgi:hypothetical protein